jgi:hypothetical protein
VVTARRMEGDDLQARAPERHVSSRSGYVVSQTVEKVLSDAGGDE